MSTETGLDCESGDTMGGVTALVLTSLRHWERSFKDELLEALDLDLSI
jgi:hypothetical protein